MGEESLRHTRHTSAHEHQTNPGFLRNGWILSQHSHILAPLTELTGKKAFVWEDKHQEAFEQMKALIAMDAPLAYPNHNKPFDIETDASDYQLGAIIKQDNRPIAYYTRKLNSAQKNYTTIEKELLSIVETLNEFRSMLLGAPITIYTGHKNSTHKLSSFSTQCVLRWRLLLEEFGCNYKYKEGS
jgi:RNase H-like domain found in reverse transcriptase